MQNVSNKIFQPNLGLLSDIWRRYNQVENVTKLCKNWSHSQQPHIR